MSSYRTADAVYSRTRHDAVVFPCLNTTKQPGYPETGRLGQEGKTALFLSVVSLFGGDEVVIPKPAGSFHTRPLHNKAGRLEEKGRNSTVQVAQTDQILPPGPKPGRQASWLAAAIVIH